MIPYIEKTAIISPCEKYRYMLRRVWNYDRMRALVVMLNPSTADGQEDDATIRSLYRLLDTLGFGSFEVANLFAYRATDPKEITWLDSPTAIGEGNDSQIEAIAHRCDVPIIAWGAHSISEHCHGTNRSAEIISQLEAIRPALFCFGTTLNGSPRHPLYMKTGTVLETYRKNPGEEIAKTWPA